MKTRSGLIPTSLLVVLAMTATVVQAEPLTLDGKAFDVNMLPAGADQPIANTLTFHSGTFLSAICVDHDFPQASYSAMDEDGVVRFQVHAESYTKGHMIWEGAVEDGQLQASAIWHRPDREEPIRFSISGSQKSR